jgi:hypothetical protein
MSSVIAHLAAGAAVHACRGTGLRQAPVRGLLPACLVLAVLPDIDYLAWWLLHMNAEPRVTHSLAFGAAAAGLAWLACRTMQRGAVLRTDLFLVLLAAAASHLLLDFLVGVHPLPLAWPAWRQGFASPIGLMPSAGRLAFNNPYLWRNLLIEAGILGPLMAGAVALRRRPAGQRFGSGWWLGATVCGGFLAWSASLQR